MYASAHDIDAIAVWPGGPLTDGGHPVVWFAGEVAGEWPDLRAWWRRMLVLPERSLAHVRALTGRAHVLTVRPTRLDLCRGSSRTQRRALL